MARLNLTLARLLAALFAGLIFATTGAQAGAAPRVVADIAPLHSLAVQVMEGVGEPELLLRAGTSPHDYSMRPSEAQILARADIVVWTGPVLTPWLQQTLATLAPDSAQIALSALEGVTLLPVRTDARFEGHDDHDADDHENELGIDPHLWLDPRNAAVLVTELARVLSERDPDHAARYRSNAQATLDRLAALETEIAALMVPLQSQPYLVFHDAYHYFENRFAIQAVGAVSLSDGVRPGARRIRELQQLIADQAVVCVFSEPQFEPKLLRRLTEGTSTGSGVLDPIGAAFPPGRTQYEQTLRALADGLSDCLTP